MVRVSLIIVVMGMMIASGRVYGGQEQEIPVLQERDSLFGKVLEITDSYVVLSSYDEEEETFEEKRINLDFQTHWEASSSLADVQKGDLLDVEYFLKDGQAIAYAVTEEKINDAGEPAVRGRKETSLDKAADDFADKVEDDVAWDLELGMAPPRKAERDSK